MNYKKKHLYTFNNLLIAINKFKIHICFILFIQSIPLKNSFFLAEIGGIKLSIANIFAFLLLILLIFKILQSWKVKLFQFNLIGVKCIWVITLSFLFMILSTIFNGIYSFSILVKFLGFSLCLTLPVFLISTKRMFIFTLISILILAVWVEVITILMGLGYIPTLYRTADMIGYDLFLYRSPGVMQAFGDHAVILSTVILFCCHLLLTKPENNLVPINKKIALILILFFFYSTLALQSRNVFLTILLSISLFFLFNLWVLSKNNIKKRVLVLSMIIFLSIFFVLSAINLGGIFIGYMLKIRGANQFERIGIYKHAINLFWNSPFYGIGIGNFFRLSGKYEHNLIISILLSGGFLGLICFLFALSMTLFSLVKLLKNKESEHRTLTLLVLCNFIGILFAGQFYLQFESWLFWLLYGITLSYINLGDKLYSSQAAVY